MHGECLHLLLLETCTALSGMTGYGRRYALPIMQGSSLALAVNVRLLGEVDVQQVAFITLVIMIVLPGTDRTYRSRR